MLNKKRSIGFLIVAGMFLLLISPVGVAFGDSTQNLNDEVMCTMDYAPVCGVDGVTYSNRCAAEDQNKVRVVYEGECEAVACFDLYAPVCGVDGYTYGNRCIAFDRNRVEVAYEGECEEVFCTEEYAPVCGVDGATYSNRCVAEQQKKVRISHEGECAETEEEGLMCTMEYAPVCGVDGVTYSNRCFADKVQVAHSGECGVDEIELIELRAQKLNNNQLSEILLELNLLRSLVKEQQVQLNYLQKLLLGVARVTEQMQNSINSFIAYGVDENTTRLGEGERAAVMYSYKEAYGKLPEGEADLADAIKIANGRWPSNINKAAEDRAKNSFNTIYKRQPNMADAKDNAAVTIMAYGLRQKAENRNLDSERNGIRIFKSIYNKTPESTRDWNIVQAISYSGASR